MHIYLIILVDLFI